MSDPVHQSFVEKLQSRRRLIEIATVVVIMIIAVVILPTSLSAFRLNLLGRWLSLAIVAISIDLIWGYTGLLSLGHGVYFALGGYCLGMHLSLMAPRGRTPAGVPLPDFMAFGGLEQLPFWWEPFRNPWVAMGAVMVVPGIVALILGYFIFRNRIKGVYFAIITQATSLVLGVLIVGYLQYTAGTNGLTNFDTFFGANVNTSEFRRTVYVVTCLVLLACYIFSRWLTSGKFGRMMIAIRDDEFRARYAGYHVDFYKLMVYVISAVLAGIGGALFVPQVLIIDPTRAGIVQSIEFVIMVAIGGRGTIVGAIVGAIIFNALRTYLSESYPDYWLFAQGLMLLLVVLFLPLGLIGVIREWSKRIRIGSKVIFP